MRESFTCHGKHSANLVLLYTYVFEIEVYLLKARKDMKNENVASAQHPLEMARRLINDRSLLAS